MSIIKSNYIAFKILFSDKIVLSEKFRGTLDQMKNEKEINICIFKYSFFYFKITFTKFHLKPKSIVI